MRKLPVTQNNTRLGLYYFPDTLHFRENDLRNWLPELEAMRISWLTIKTPLDRAIPEKFIRSLIDHEIEPILLLNLPLQAQSHKFNLSLLFDTYARWGVNFISLFDRPNLRSKWSPTSWAQNNLVERFLDIYIPLADSALKCNLIPIFPPLEPGGDYWDTAFLRAALHGIQRRGYENLLENVVIGAYSNLFNHPLDWGIGGPESWPTARPYLTTQDSEDHQGFRIFDWYQAICRSVIHKPCNIILFESLTDPIININNDEISETHYKIVQMMINDNTKYEPVPDEVLTFNFWLSYASENSPYASQSWFQSDESTLPIVAKLKELARDGSKKGQDRSKNIPTTPIQKNKNFIQHYLLLPSYEWGIADWHLDAIRPFIQKYRPTVGFSIEEATLSNKVTIIGGEQSFPDTVIENLISAGCVVERINGDGTTIASKLATI
jgi:hypothetical protein